MQLRFPFLILFISILFCSGVYLLHIQGFVIPQNEIYIRISLLLIFIISTIIIGYTDLKKIIAENKSKGNIVSSLLISLLLISTFQHEKIGFYATMMLSFVMIVYAFLLQKKYAFNKTNYALIFYALVLITGTFSSTNGFHIPEISIIIFVVPLAFNCVQLSEQSLLLISHCFFKVLLLFMAVSIVYWWFNFLYIDTTFANWITAKNSFQIDGLNWPLQTKNTYGNVFSAYYFVNSWSYYFHPTFTSYVLLVGLIMGVNLGLTTSKIKTASYTEILIYTLLCGITLALMESRIGIVGLTIIVFVSTLYYIKLHTCYFKYALILAGLVALIVMYNYNEHILNFANDEVRDYYILLAKAYIREHFWWGAGFNEQTVVLEQQAYKLANMYPVQYLPICYTHNQLLGNMVQIGILGAVAVVFMLASIALKAIKTKSFMLMLFLFISMLFMYIEEPLSRIDGTVRFIVLLSFMLQFTDSSRANGL